MLTMLLLWLGVGMSAQEPTDPSAHTAPAKVGEQDHPGRTGRMGPPDRGQAAQWWKGMSEAERRQASDRWQRYRALPEESKAELRRRMELVKTETKLLLDGLSVEQRAELDALSAPQRRRAIHQMVRQRMEIQQPDSAPDLGHPPGPNRPDFRQQPLHQRLGDSGKQIDQSRRQRLERELKAAVKDGWIGPRAARHLMQVPPDQVIRELHRVQQWRLIEKFDREGEWEKLKISPQQRKRFVGMEPDEFLRSMRQFRGHRRGKLQPQPPTERPRDHPRRRRG
jgi:hypothetical protein